MVALARDLLGATLASGFGGERVSGIIVETEAYLGVHDPASHAWNGRRHKLNLGIYAEAGRWYVYRSYGIHWCLNLTTGPAGEGAAVLVRAVRPVDGIDIMRLRRGVGVADHNLANGPGKLTQAFGITGEHDGMIANEDALLSIEPKTEPRGTIVATPRIGITRAADWPARFLLRHTPDCS